MRYYSNRELSQKVGIKLSRWKRWSREFLALDPLGGMQSGYARQLTIDDAFTVYLGGHLVGELKFGVPVARKILADLYDWLGASGFYQTLIYRSTDLNNDQKVLAYQIYIATREQLPISYIIRGVLEEAVVSAHTGCFRTVRYWEQVIGNNDIIPSEQVTGERTRLLNISSVYVRFAGCLDPG